MYIHMNVTRTLSYLLLVYAVVWEGLPWWIAAVILAWDIPWVTTFAIGKGARANLAKIKALTALYPHGFFPRPGSTDDEGGQPLQ